MLGSEPDLQMQVLNSVVPSSKNWTPTDCLFLDSCSTPSGANGEYLRRDTQ